MIKFEAFSKRLIRRNGKWIWDEREYEQNEPHPKDSTDSIMSPLRLRVIHFTEDYSI